MKILNIEIKNNKTIGDLSLDFTNDNISSNCVVLVGDNGTGKSTILKAIKSMFSDAGDVYYDSFEGEIRIKVELSESTKEIWKITNKTTQSNNIFYISVSGDYSAKFVSVSEEGGLPFINEGLLEFSMRPNPCAYISGDNHGYFKNSLYEVNKIGPERLNDIYNVHIDLDQLLVNANYQDMSDSFQSGEKRELPTRISIFANAFNSFFKTNNLAFKKVDTNFRVIFEKGGKEFSSKDFSSGESNIYYMAGKILQNSLLLGNLIIIDEPETGLHPNWQIKLIDYCKTLSRNRQIIIATHSPFVVSSITEGDKLIILKREEDKIMVDLENKYYSIGEVEKVVKSMPIMVEVNKDRIQLLVAGITDQMYLEQTINLWKKTCNELNKIRICYPFRGKGSSDNRGGDAALLRIQKAFLPQPNNFFLYDWDIETTLKNQALKLENTIIMELPMDLEDSDFYNSQKDINLSGIENFIDIPEEYLKKYKLDPSKEAQKVELANDIIKNIKDKSIFKKLKDFLIYQYIKKDNY